MQNSNIKIPVDNQKWFLYSLGGMAVLATLYNILTLLPIFSAYFLTDDIFNLNLGAVMRHDPLSFLFFTLGGWWRPLGFTLPAIVYLIFGLQVLPFHIIAYLIHLGTALSLLFLAKKMFNWTVALLAYILYVTSAISAITVGFSTYAFMDEFSTLLFIMVILVMYRKEKAPSLSRRPYWLAGLFYFLAAACKDSWIGLAPALILLDFLNYRNDKLSHRILRLLPSGLVLIIPLGRLAITGPEKFLAVQSLYAASHLTSSHLIWSLTIPFVPPLISIGDATLFNTRLAFPLLFFILAWWLYRSERFLIVLLLVAFVGLWAVLYASPLDAGLSGWMHFPPLIAIAAMIMSVTLYSLIDHFKPQWFFILLSVAWLGVYIVPQQKNFYNLYKITISKADEFEICIRNIKKELSGLPPNSHAYVIAGPDAHLVRENFIPPHIIYTTVAIRKAKVDIEPRSSNEYKIFDTVPNILVEGLIPKLDDPNTHIFFSSEGELRDVTENFRLIDKEQLRFKNADELSKIFWVAASK